jgi:zinc transport system permease protein
VSLTDALHLAFMQRALAAGVLIAVMAGLLGVFVVQRRLSFLGAGLAHAAFGGMGLGAFVIVSSGLLASGVGLLHHPLWIAAPFSLLAALAIAWVREHTQLSSDTAIGVFFAVSVALGVLFFSIIPPDVNLGLSLMDLLFGSILAVTGPDLVAIAVVAALAAAFLLGLWGRLGYATFDDELARTDGVPTRLLEYLLFACAALVIAVSSVVVGIILMAAYLVIPAASARLLARSLAQMTVLSVLLAVLSTVVGLALSYLVDVPSGSAIVLVQAALFLVAAAAARR